MVLSADVINLVLYCVQQLGVTLGVGAETILLVAYISAIRDGVIDSEEAQFSRAVRGVLNLGLLLIILSGIGITVLHVMAGELAVVLTPAYLFKWALIVLALLFTVLNRTASQGVLEGVAGGTWYALFLVHILAPETTWINLLTLYGVWLAGFSICWWALVVLLYGKKGAAVTSVAATHPRQSVMPARVLPAQKTVVASIAAPAAAAKKHSWFGWFTKLFAKKSAVVPPASPAPLPKPPVSAAPPAPPIIKVFAPEPAPTKPPEPPAVIKVIPPPSAPAFTPMSAFSSLGKPLVGSATTPTPLVPPLEKIIPSPASTGAAPTIVAPPAPPTPIPQSPDGLLPTVQVMPKSPQK